MANVTIENAIEARRRVAELPGGADALAVIDAAWEEKCRGPGLYPQTVFHFTDKAGLLGILNSNFKITYSLERIECQPFWPASRNSGESADRLPVNRVFGAPMVSFCDLRLSELGVHMRDYGSYGLGMSKSWAIQSGLNPVYYISAHAQLLQHFIESMSHLYELSNAEQESNALNQTYHRLLNFYRYLKNYDAPLYRKGKLVRQHHRFANEREWRFVPPIDQDSAPFVSESFMSDPDKKAQANRRYEDSPLVFSPEDINYVIVEDDVERAEIISHIEAAKQKNYPDDQIARLKSRILTATQIREDV